MYTLLHNSRVLLEDGRFDERGVLLRGDEIAAVIPRGETAALAARDDVRAVDIGRRFVIPGFVDAHFHLMALAMKSLRCDLGPARDRADLVDRLARYAKGNPDGSVVGVEWDESAWPDTAFPTRTDLDGVSADRPVFARRICGHAAVVNTAFLGMLDAPARFVDRDTGVITEDAVEAANKLTYPPRDAIVAGVDRAIARLHELGVTGIHDIVGTRNYDAYLDGLRASTRPLRIDAFFHAGPDDFAELRDHAADIPDHRFRPTGIKLFTDGSLGGHTAALHEPYADGAGSGELLLSDDYLSTTTRRCAELGVACAIHAIGDRATAQVLDHLRRVNTGEPLFRIEHAELLGDAELDTLAETKVFLAMQPNFVRNWAGEGGLYHRRLGEARWRCMNRFRSLESRGIPYVFSSDGMPPGPLYGLRGATHHPVAEEAIDPLTALRRYTVSVHGLGRHARPAGAIAAGRLADLTILSASPLLGADAVRVEATWVGGREVFRDASWRSRSGGRMASSRGSARRRTRDG